MINLDETVKFVEKPSSDLYSLKVLQGPYLGVIYTYGKVTLYEDEANCELKVKFKFKLEEVPNNLNKEELEKSVDFKNFMGDILSQLLEEKNNKSTNTWDKPSIEVFDQWLDEWSKIKGVNKYNVYLTGAFCQNYFFNGNIDTSDIDVTLEPKEKNNINYYELKNILEEAEKIGFAKKLFVDIYCAEDAVNWQQPDKTITLGKNTEERSNTERWSANSEVTELIPGLYEIVDDSTDAYNKYLSKKYDVLSKKIL